MTPDDIIAVISAGLCHGADKAAEYDLARLIVLVRADDCDWEDVQTLCDEIEANGREGWLARALAGDGPTAGRQLTAERDAQALVDAIGETARACGIEVAWDGAKTADERRTMSESPETPKCEHEYYYYPSTNEDGWKCAFCKDRPGEPPGFSPHLDRELIDRKVFCLVNDVHEAGLVHMSNGTHGDVVAATVADRCRTVGRYDQSTILLFILEMEQPSHAEYWQRISDGIVAGADPRNRCHCGALAKVWTSSKGHACFDHAWTGEEPF